MSQIALTARTSGWQTVRRGLQVAPEITRGLSVTLLIALVSTLGRVVVPVAVQQTIDNGIRGPHGPRPGLVLAFAAAAVCGVGLTAVSSYLATVRIFRSTEAGLATLRVAAFRHVHDLSMLSQNAERRGGLVGRVTTDVDTISTFVQVGGLLLVLSAGQLTMATILMAIYSWPLAVLVGCVSSPCWWPSSTYNGWCRGPTARFGSGSATCWGPFPSRWSVRTRSGRTRFSTVPSIASTVRWPCTRAPRFGRRCWSRSVSPVGFCCPVWWSPRWSGWAPGWASAAGCRWGGCWRFCSSCSCSRRRSRWAPRCSTSCRTRSPVCAGCWPCWTHRPMSPTPVSTAWTCRAARSACSSTESGSAIPTVHRCCAVSTCNCLPAPGSPWWARPDPARRRWPSCSPG